MTKKNKFSYHHLLPESKEIEGYNTDVMRNIVKMRDRLHVALHQLCGNMTPRDQLKEWLQLHESILTKGSRKALEELIRMEDEDFYHGDLIKKI